MEGEPQKAYRFNAFLDNKRLEHYFVTFFRRIEIYNELSVKVYFKFNPYQFKSSQVKDLKIFRLNSVNSEIP